MKDTTKPEKAIVLIVLDKANAWLAIKRDVNKRTVTKHSYSLQ